LSLVNDILYVLSFLKLLQLHFTCLDLLLLLDHILVVLSVQASRTFQISAFTDQSA